MKTFEDWCGCLPGVEAIAAAVIRVTELGSGEQSEPAAFEDGFVVYGTEATCRAVNQRVPQKVLASALLWHSSSSLLGSQLCAGRSAQPTVLAVALTTSALTFRCRLIRVFWVTG